MNGLQVSLIFIICVILFFVKNPKINYRFQITLMFYLVIFTVFDRLITAWGIFLLVTLIIIYFFLRLANGKELSISKQIPYHSVFFVLWFIYASIQMLILDVYTEFNIRHYQAFIIGIVTIWLMSSLIKSNKLLEKLYMVWGIGILLTVFIGWWELITGNHLVVLWDHFLDKVTVNYFNPNNYSFLLSVSFPIIIYWIEKKRIFYKIIGLFMLISTFYFVYVNGSRLNLIILFFVVCIYLFKVLFKHKELLIFITAISVIFLSSNFAKNSFEMLITLDEELNSTAIGSRNFLYASAWNIFLENPLGVGAGKVDSYIYNMNLHNFWLEILANYGILIFVGLIVFFCLTLLKLMKTIYKKAEISEQLIPIFWSIMIFIPASLGPSSVMTFGITWFLLGLMVCATNIIKRYEINNLNFK